MVYKVFTIPCQESTGFSPFETYLAQADFFLAQPSKGRRLGGSVDEVRSGEVAFHGNTGDVEKRTELF